MKIKDLILKTEKVNWQDLKDLQPVNLKNNYHSDKTKNSIIKNGFARAIYVWQDSKGDIYTVDGHLRADILRELKNDGYDIPNELNCTFLDLPNKKTAIKYLLQVFNQKTNPINQESMEVWLDDNEIVLEDMEIELDELHIELNDELEVEEEQEEVKEDEVPEVKHSFVVKGDLFELIDEEQGLNHRVLCGDSTMIDDVEKVMNGEKADLMITDLPYGVSYADKNNFLNNLGKGNKIQKEIKNDHIAPNELYHFAKNIYIPAYSIMNKKNSYYAFMPQGGEQMMMMMALKDSGFQVKHELIWLKNNHVLGRADYCYKHEPICYGWTDKGTHEFYSKDFKVSVLEFDKTVSNDLHPTMKPISILMELIANSSKQKFIIYDPTLGSGSTLIACQQTKRKCYGIELDEHYCGVVITRWKNYMEKEGKKYSIKRNGEQFTLTNGTSNII